MIRCSAQAPSGEVLFKEQCALCHPNGGNVVNPKHQLKSGHHMKTFKDFLSWIRKPESPMPPFPPAKISEAQAKELYAFIQEQIKISWK